MAGVQDVQHGDLTSIILRALDKKEPLLSAEAFPSHKSADVKSALDRLASRFMVTYETIDREEAILEAEGQDITANGSHEARVFAALQHAMEGLTMAELEKAVGDKNTVKVGQMRAFKSKWIAKGKEGRFVASVCCITQSRDFTNNCRLTQLRTKLENNCKSYKRSVHIQTPRWSQT
jgi:phenylalanyl-tRNA synthetase alpha chain